MTSLEGIPLKQDKSRDSIADSFLTKLDSVKEHAGPLSSQEREGFFMNVIETLQQIPGGVYCEDVNDIYKTITDRVYVRREDPEKAFAAVLTQTPLTIDCDDAHLNATEWDGGGDVKTLHNPFIEGFSHIEGLVTVLGFAQAPTVTKHEARHDTDGIKDSSVVPDRDVAISGTIDSKELLFLVVRIPAAYVPDDALSLDEQVRKEEGVLRYLFRGTFLNARAIPPEHVH